MCFISAAEQENITFHRETLNPRYLVYGVSLLFVSQGPSIASVETAIYLFMKLIYNVLLKDGNKCDQFPNPTVW